MVLFSNYIIHVKESATNMGVNPQYTPKRAAQIQENQMQNEQH